MHIISDTQVNICDANEHNGVVRKFVEALKVVDKLLKFL